MDDEFFTLGTEDELDQEVISSPAGDEEMRLGPGRQEVGGDREADSHDGPAAVEAGPSSASDRRGRSRARLAALAAAATGLVVGAAWVVLHAGGGAHPAGRTAAGKPNRATTKFGPPTARVFRGATDRRTSARGTSRAHKSSHRRRTESKSEPRSTPPHRRAGRAAPRPTEPTPASATTRPTVPTAPIPTTAMVAPAPPPPASVARTPRPSPVPEGAATHPASSADVLREFGP